MQDLTGPNPVAEVELPLTARLSPEEFEWLSGQGTRVDLGPGEQISNNGDLANNFYVLVDGELRVAQQGDREERVLTCVEDEEPLLIGTPFLASVRAVQPSHLVKVGAETYLQQVQASSPANHLLVSGLVWRLRIAESFLHQSEKLAALGQMSAGLTHELNNPAAASRRAAGQLRDSLRKLHRLTFDLQELELNPAQLEELAGLQQEVVDQASATVQNPLAISDQEEELSRWLEELGVEEPWELAPRLVASGLDRAEAEAFAGRLPPQALEVALRWVSSVVGVGELLRIVEQSTTRISELVAAVKSYTYMDRGSRQEVDIHAGLESTLLILGHKLQDIEVRREYEADLPPIQGYGGELNQVWTNLLDNAIEALEEGGQIRVRTWREGPRVVVEIADDGPGIPDEVRPFLFRSFFTTKKPGKGTGMGLSIVYQIVVQRHGGDITVSSQPGDTRFRVYLPIEPESE
ncbi:MAG TPA: ATP-binding protein [Anaerolineae bacterium]|nr:ATP-binding protein [Anaerolineae bacterium]